MNQNPPTEPPLADDDYSESLISADLIQYIPEDKRGEFIREIVLQVEHYSGIIPHPSIVGRWERIMPGSAERILSLSEKHQEHRMEIERTMFGDFVKREQFGGVANHVDMRCSSPSPKVNVDGQCLRDLRDLRDWPRRPKSIFGNLEKQRTFVFLFYSK